MLSRGRDYTASSNLTIPAGYASAHSESSALSPRPEQAVMFTNTRRRGLALSSGVAYELSSVIPSRTSSVTIELPRTGHLSCTNPDPSIRTVPQAPPMHHGLSTEKDLPRLPTPDFAGVTRRPFMQAMTAPLNYFWGRSMSRGGNNMGGREGQDIPEKEQRNRTNATSSAARSISIGSKRSNTSEKSKADVSRASSSRQPYYLKHGHHTHSSLVEEEDDLDDVMSAYLDLPVLDKVVQPPARRTTITSPNPNDYQHWLTSEKPATLEKLIPMLQLTSARFTQKFPETAVRRVGASMDGTGGAYGVEGVSRWTGYKWVLMLSVVLVFVMGLAGLSLVLNTWFTAWPNSQIVITVEYNILVFSTLASCIILLTSLVGVSGTLLNSRPMLAFYSLLLWPSFVSCLIVGYTAYKRHTFNLPGKMSQGWNDMWGDYGREAIQNTLSCCGFRGPFVDPYLTSTCYPRSLLPACQGPLIAFESSFLQQVYILIFSTVPVHLFNIYVSLICSNHVNTTFGKGMTPKAYRLSLEDVQANAKTIIMHMEATRIPYEPERSRGKKVKDF
ncbi:hypothetical protein FRB95_013096 [Tulasnella sp. JGI-2019a]|nr:hypothetical protein FRB93_012739 [Tulasnella sp. JGI-2019a]KAG9034529.1 hypothetical protein FRB95_013096 [Tulasnella sp. JGI-2019a]